MWGSVPGWIPPQTSTIASHLPKAVGVAREQRAPVFLHLPTVRLWGLAGTDVEGAYPSPEEIRRTEAADPLLRNAERLLALGAASREQLTAIVERTRVRVRELTPVAARAPKLPTVAQVVAPLAP